MWVPERDGDLSKGCTALLRKPHRGPVFVSLSRCLTEYKTGSGPFNVGLVISHLGAADWWANVLRSFVVWDGLDQRPQPGWVGHAGSLGHGCPGGSGKWVQVEVWGRLGLTQAPNQPYWSLSTQAPCVHHCQLWPSQLPPEPHIEPALNSFSRLLVRMLQNVCWPLAHLLKKSSICSTLHTGQMLDSQPCPVSPGASYLPLMRLVQKLELTLPCHCCSLYFYPPYPTTHPLPPYPAPSPVKRLEAGTVTELGQLFHVLGAIQGKADCLTG